MKDFLLKNKSEIILYLFLIVIISIMVMTYNTIDMDYWARLIQGNFFWHTGHILKEDIFSFTPTHLWIDHEWGSSVIFSFIQNHFGFKGILLFRTLIVSLIFFFLFKTINIQTKSTNNLLNIIYLIAVIYAIPTISMSGLRCHFFTFLFFTIFLYILELVRKEDKNKLLFILPLMMLFWANIHGGCVSGLGLVGIYLTGEFLNKKQYKKYLITLFACIAVLFINPYGIDYVKFIFMAATMERPFVTEWISAFAHPNWQFMIEFKFLFILNLILIFKDIKNFKNDYTKYILLFICAFISAKYVKNTPFFIIVSSIFLYEIYFNFLNSFIEKHKKKIYLLTFAFLLTFPVKELFKSFPIFPLSQQPLQVVEFIKINNLKGNIIAPFDYGSYIIYKLYPYNLIYMDGRYEEVYYDEQKKLIDDFYNVQKDWYKILTLNPDYIIVPSNAILNDYLEQVKDFKLIYNDNTNCLYGKNALVKKHYFAPSNDAKYYIKHAFNSYFNYI